jgi:serine/threonine-protein kinase
MLCDYDGSPLHIVHRDISPHNVFITYDGAVKILDFGIATTAGAGLNTDVGEVKGKIAYMAPEQLMGEDVDQRADIFSVGAMLWEAAVGSRMWENLSEPRLMHQLVTGNIPRPSERATIEPELENIIRKATAPVREQRYQSAIDLHHDLASYLMRSNASWSMRDVGAALGETFKEERENQKKTLGAALVQPLASRESTVGTSDVPVSATRPQSSRQNVWTVVAAALLFTTLVVGWLLLRSREGERAAAQVSIVPAPALVDINIRATPPEAKIEVDGEDRGTHGVALRVEADARDHVIEARVPGYVSQTRTIKFDRSQDVELVLGKIAVAPAEPTPSAASARKSALPRAAGSAAPGNEPSCNPGYYYENGIKTYKPECL